MLLGTAHNMLSDLSARAEAFLFSEGGALTLRKLEQLVGAKKEELSTALDELGAHLEGSGLSLIRTETDVSLSTAPRAAEAIKKAYEEDLARDIGEAGLEVLSILLYRGASTRAQIDYIRGVNTSSTIRTLLARGLVERVVNEKDAREYIYRPTAELLAHLGVRRANELPEHDVISTELAAFEKAQHATNDHE